MMNIFGGTKRRASSLIAFSYLLSLNVVQVESNLFQQWSEITTLSNNLHPWRDKTKKEN